MEYERLRSLQEDIHQAKKGLAISRIEQTKASQLLFQRIEQLESQLDGAPAARSHLSSPRESSAHSPTPRHDVAVDVRSEAVGCLLDDHLGDELAAKLSGAVMKALSGAAQERDQSAGPAVLPALLSSRFKHYLNKHLPGI